MFILSGDVHHMGLKTNDQKWLPGTEAECTQEYVDIAESLGIKTTLFFTGRLALDEAKTLRGIARRKNVEFGGHTFQAFQPLLLHRLSKFFLGQFNGPKFYQRWDIHWTKALLERISDHPMTSWRNHAYLSDKNTIPLLREKGIGILSDERNSSVLRPYLAEGILHAPINVIPDHEHLLHAHRTSEYVQQWVKKTDFCDCWGSASYPAKEWEELVVAQTEEIIRKGGIATLLIHPACMKVLDNFHTFRRILKRLSRYTSLWMNELPSQSLR